MPARVLARACPVCGSRRGRLLLPLCYALFDDLGIPGESDLVCCAECGMVFNDLADTQSRLDTYYRNQAHYLASNTAGGGGHGPQELARYQRLMARLPGLHGTASQMLDIGCGKGGLLRYATQHGLARAVGIETAEPSRDYCRDSLGLEVHASLDDLGGKVFDVIVMSHVLEHLAEPLATLRALRPLCHAHGRVCLEVPDTAALPATGHPWQGLYYEHINHFVLESLRRLVHAAGLTILAEERWPFLADDPASPACLFLICAPQSEPLAAPHSPAPVSVFESAIVGTPVSRQTIDAIHAQPGPLALWGVSQYAQLVLGMHPRLAPRLVGLFDASPAKVGRAIGGVVVRPPSDIDALPAGTALLLPKSAYLAEQRVYLDNLPFTGPRFIL